LIVEKFWKLEAEKVIIISLDIYSTVQLRNEIDKIISRFISKNAYIGYVVGYEIATKAIEENWSPQKVRSELAAKTTNW